MSVFAPALIRADRPITSALTSAITAVLNRFNFASVYAAGDVGSIWDASDLSRMYQDIGGTIPVTAAGQNVGLQLDQRGVFGSEIYTGQNSEAIDNSSGGAVYTFTESTRTMTVSVAGSSNSYPRPRYSLGLTSGAQYFVRGRIDGNRAMILRIRLALAGSVNDISYNATTGVFSGVVNAGSPQIEFLTNGTIAGSYNIAELSIKPLSGVHRAAPSDALRPVLRQRADGPYYLDFTGGKSIQALNSTGRFNYLHNGSGGSVVALIEWHQGTVDSNYLYNATGTTQIGIQFFKSAASESVSKTVYRGVSGTTASAATLSRCFLSSPLRMVRFSYKNDGTASDMKASTDSSVSVVNAATAAAPSSADASLNLQVPTNFNGHEYLAMTINRVLGETEVKNLYPVCSQRDYQTPSVDLTLILGGQSNMSGRGTVVTTAAEEKLIGVYSYTKAEEFRIATIPEHSVENRPIATSPDEPSPTSPAHGFALRTGKKLKTDSGKNVLLVPCAIGSTSIAQWNTPLTKGDRTTLFGAMKHRYNQAAGKNGAPVIIWYGHEADVGSAWAGVNFTTGGVGSAYQNAFTSLIQNVRAEIADAPLILVQLASDDDLSTAQNHAAAGEAQRQLELSLPNTHLVVAHDVTRNTSPDDIHVGRAGVDVIADRVALAIRQHILGEAVNGTGPRIVSATKTGSTVTLTCDKPLNTSAENYGNLFRVYAGGVEQTVTSANRGANTSTIEIVCSVALSGSVTLTYGYRAGAASGPRTDFVADADGLPLPVFGPVAVE